MLDIDGYSLKIVYVCVCALPFVNLESPSLNHLNWKAEFQKIHTIKNTTIIQLELVLG